ncbi:MAG: lipoyl(octanoyl) transferase LipB [Chloroflexota bacterium]
MRCLSAARPTTCRVYDLGRAGYRQTWQLQQRLAVARIEGKVADLLLLVEHPPVFTVGKAGAGQNIMVPPQRLSGEGIPLYYVDRGGDVTYHGPGQVVGYPILHLRERGLDLHRYVWCLEEVIIRTLAGLSIGAGRRAGHPGVWLGEQKVAAIGVRVSHWVASHGFALNVNIDLTPFNYIRPCGLEPGAVTSLRARTGQSIPLETVKNGLTGHFSTVFQTDTETASPRDLVLADEP